jgi:hypothetical protein
MHSRGLLACGLGPARSVWRRPHLSRFASHGHPQASWTLVGDEAICLRRDGPGEKRDDDQSFSSRIAHAAGAEVSGAGRSA